MRVDFPHLAPNHILSQHLVTIIIIIVHFGIKSYAQLALTSKIGETIPPWSSVGNYLRVHIVSWVSLFLYCLLYLSHHHDGEEQLVLELCGVLQLLDAVQVVQGVQPGERGREDEKE